MAALSAPPTRARTHTHTQMPHAPCPWMHQKGRGLEGGLRDRLDRRLEEVAKAVGGGYCLLQMPLRPALGVRGTVAGHRLGALEAGGRGTPPPFQFHSVCLEVQPGLA